MCRATEPRVTKRVITEKRSSVSNAVEALLDQSSEAPSESTETPVDPVEPVEPVEQSKAEGMGKPGLNPSEGSNAVTSSSIDSDFAGSVADIDPGNRTWKKHKKSGRKKGSKTTCEVEISKAFKGLLLRCRYKVFYGGRGAGRSWETARYLIIRALHRPTRILCTREIQKSIKDSVHRLLKDQIDLLGVTPAFTVTDTEIRCKNGSVFLFEGLKGNITKIKSMEGIDCCWVEEAEHVSEDSWSILDPTIRKKHSEIVVTFNPDAEEDPTYKRMVYNLLKNCAIYGKRRIDEDGELTVKSGLVYEAEGEEKARVLAIVRHTTWRDNEYFPDDLKRLKNRDWKTDPDRARWVWDGECRSHSDAQILKDKWIVKSFEIEKEASAKGTILHGPYFGGDWGFVDPTTLVRCWVIETPILNPKLFKRNLYIDYEIYETSLDIDKVPSKFAVIPGVETHVVRADNARPETISYVRRNGIRRIEAVKKWPGSVEDGIAYLRSFDQIVVHSRCKKTIEEAKNYSWKVDKLSGDVMDQPVDKYNHIWDAVRYALQPLIKTPKKTAGVW